MKADDEIQAHAASLIKAWRIEKGYSQADLAEKLDMHQSAVAKIENLDRKIDFSTMVRISEILGIPWEDLKTERLTEKDKLQQSLRSYLVGANLFLSNLRVQENTAEGHAKVAKALEERLQKAVESGEYPESPPLEKVLEGIRSMLEIARRNAPPEGEGHRVTGSLDPLRELQHVLESPPYPFHSIEDDERIAAEYLARHPEEDASS